MASTAPQADSWWPGHVEPDDVVNADIASQALDIFLHSPESANKNGIVNTFTHTSIPIHPCTLLKKHTHKQQKENAQLTKHDAFIYWASSCPVCWWATFRIFGTCSTSEALSPKTVLTENSCESVQQILQHSLAGQKTQLTKHDAFSLTGPLPVQCGGRRRQGSLADAPQDCSTSEDFSPRTVLTKTFVDVFNAYCSIWQKAMPFLTLSTISYSSMASTAPQGDSWWPGHVEPDDVVNADIAGQALDIFLHGPESANKNGILKTFTHSSIPIRPCTLLKKNTHKQQQQNAQLTKHDAFIYWFSSDPVCWWATFRIFGTCSTSEALSPKTVLTENSCESVQQILQHSLAGQKNSTHQTRCLFFDWSSSCPMWWSATSRKLGRCSSGLFHVGGLLA